MPQVPNAESHQASESVTSKQEMMWKELTSTRQPGLTAVIENNSQVSLKGDRYPKLRRDELLFPPLLTLILEMLTSDFQPRIPCFLASVTVRPQQESEGQRRKRSEHLPTSLCWLPARSGVAGSSAFMTRFPIGKTSYSSALSSTSLLGKEMVMNNI